MKRIPKIMLTDEERKAQSDKRRKSRAELALFKSFVDAKAKLAAEAGLLRAAKAVVAHWPKKDLVTKVRELDFAIADYEEATR